MIGHRHELVEFQSVHYHKQYHRFLRLIIVELCIILALILSIFYFIYFPVTPIYYATTSEGRVLLISNYS